MLTVVIPWFNKDTLVRVINGLLDQTDLGFETIIVNDAGDANYLQQLLSCFPEPLQRNIQVHNLPQADGKFRAGAARNYGAFLANEKSTRILFLDSDCVPARYIVEQHKAYGTDNRLIIGAIRNVPQTCPPIESKYSDRMEEDPRPRLYKQFGEEVGVDLKTVTEEFAACWAGHISVPTKEFCDLGGFWEEDKIFGADDQELAWRMHQAGTIIQADFTLKVFHMEHPRWVHNLEGQRKRNRAVTKSKNLPLVRQGQFLPQPATVGV